MTDGKACTGNKKRRSISLSAVTLTVAAVIAAASVAACAVIFAVVYGSAMKSNAINDSTRTVKQTAETMAELLSRREEKLRRIAAGINDQQDMAGIITVVDSAARLDSDISAVMVYDRSGKLLACGADGKTFKTGAVSDKSYESAVSLKDGAVFSRPHTETLFETEPSVITAAVRQMCGVTGGEILIAADFLFSDISGFIDRSGVGIEGYCFITDKNGDIIYHPQHDLLIKGKKYEDTSFVRDSADGYTVTGSTVKILDTVGAHGWRVVGISYTDEINAAVKSSLEIVIPVSVLICVISAAVYLCVYDRLVTRPVRRLIKAMGEFESNAESYEYDASAPNIRELEAVSRSFGHTVSMIKEFITEIRESEKERRKSEFRALQAQIDPHFLYNTLDSIQWMCEAGNTKDAAKMVAALAKLFRISLSRGRELITVGEEITHAKSYMVIQSFRYGDRFECEFNVDESLSGYSCCKVIIQPMLENAIYHGIGQIADDGRITVTVRKDGDFIAIDVADNGVGMTKEQCEAALSGTLGGGTGFGVRNVDQRLKLAFGNESCVTIKSVPDEGTTVTLKFSAVLPEEKA